MRRWFTAVAVCAALVGCGGPFTGPVKGSATDARQALTSAPELLEFESPASRQELYREVARTSSIEAGHPVKGPVLFALSTGTELVAAPALDPREDLLQPADAGHPLELAFGDHADDRWPEDRRDSLQGLSEHEAAELVSRSLLAHWGISPTGTIEIDRAAGAPYAAAYVDGILRINPSFLYLAASMSAAPTVAQAQ